MSEQNTYLAEKHYDEMVRRGKARCGLCMNCTTVRRWENVYWGEYIKNGGDKEWAKKQLELEANGLPCQRTYQGST